MNKKIIVIGIVALLMLVNSGSAVNAWPWNNNNDNHKNINFDQSKFERLLQDGQFSIQAEDINSAIKSYRRSSKNETNWTKLSKINYS